MGCSCSTKMNLRNIEREQSLDKKTLRDSVQLGVRSYAEFINGNMNIVIWAKDSDINLLFPQKYFIYTLSAKASITFNVIPYIPQNTVIADCLILISNTPTDKERILKILSEYSNICIKLLISEDDVFKFPVSEVITMSTMNNFYTELFEQMKIIEKNLKQIFSDIDADQDGQISPEELKLGLGDLKLVQGSKTYEFTFAEIDLNHDGKISFPEFSYWWKRGRQGGKSLKKLIENWKFSIDNITPKVEKYFKKFEINKKKIKKSGKIEIGKFEECKLGMSLFLGTSAKREEVLRSITNTLSLLIYESWIVIKLKYKNEAVAKFNLKKTEDMIQGVKLLLLAKLNIGNEIESGILTKVALNESELYIAVVFDVQNDFINKILEVAESVENFFKSPTDDFFDLKIVSSRNLAEIPENLNFFESIGSGYVLVNCEHWEEFVNILKPRNETEELLLKFFRVNGEFLQRDLNVAQLKSLRVYLNIFLEPFIEVCNSHHLAKKFFEGFNEDLVPELELYGRYNNLGVKLSLTDNMLPSLFNS